MNCGHTPTTYTVERHEMEILETIQNAVSHERKRTAWRVDLCADCAERVIVTDVVRLVK